MAPPAQRFEPHLDFHQAEDEQRLEARLPAEDVNAMVDRLLGNRDDRAVDGALIVKALRFDTLREIVEMNSRLARQKFEEAAVAAGLSGGAANPDALRDLQEAERNARFADSAAESLRASEAAFRGANLLMILGDDEKATKASVVAADRLKEVAATTAAFGAEAPKSRFFARALRVVYAADRAATAAEQKGAAFEQEVRAKVKAFGSVMHAVAARAKDLATVVQSFPQVAREVARQKGVDVAVATVAVSRNLRNGISGWFNKKADAAISAVRGSRAWQMLGEAVEASRHAAQAASDHLTAAGALAGSAIELAGMAYRAELDNAKSRRAP